MDEFKKQVVIQQLREGGFNIIMYRHLILTGRVGLVPAIQTTGKLLL